MPCTCPLIAVDRTRYGFVLCRVLNPEAAPGHYDWRTDGPDSDSYLVQTDLDYPGIASTFGWKGCEDDIEGAIEYLDECVDNGTVVEDPGYFNGDD